MQNEKIKRKSTKKKVRIQKSWTQRGISFVLLTNELYLSFIIENILFVILIQQKTIIEHYFLTQVHFDYFLGLIFQGQ
jgi:hypothetical protein